MSVGDFAAVLTDVNNKIQVRGTVSNPPLCTASYHPLHRTQLDIAQAASVPSSGGSMEYLKKLKNIIAELKAKRTVVHRINPAGANTKKVFRLIAALPKAEYNITCVLRGRGSTGAPGTHSPTHHTPRPPKPTTHSNSAKCMIAQVDGTVYVLFCGAAGHGIVPIFGRDDPFALRCPHLQLATRERYPVFSEKDSEYMGVVKKGSAHTKGCLNYVSLEALEIVKAHAQELFDEGTPFVTLAATKRITASAGVLVTPPRAPAGARPEGEGSAAGGAFTATTVTMPTPLGAPELYKEMIQGEAAVKAVAEAEGAAAATKKQRRA